MESAALIRKKIHLLFEKIAEPGHVMNSYYVDALIEKLSNVSDPDISQLETQPFMSDCINKALSTIPNPHITVKVFLTRLQAIVSTNEMHFAKLLCRSGPGITNEFNNILSEDMNPSLRVAYLEMALRLTQHESGINWLFDTGVWKNLLSICNQKQTIFVVRQTYKFAAKFLWKLNDMKDETKLKLVLTHICRPLHDIELFKLQESINLTSEEEEQISQVVEPMLQMLLAVMKEEQRILSPNLIARILLDEESIIHHMYILMDVMRYDNIRLLSAVLAFLASISKFFMTNSNIPNGEICLEEIVESGVIYFNCIQTFAVKRAAIVLLDFCNQCNLIWAKIFKDARMSFRGEYIKLQNKLIIVCMVPCLAYIRQKNQNLMLTNERLEEYIGKFLSGHCDITVRAGYAVRDLTLELDTLNITLQSVKRLTCMRDHVNNEQANLIFQALFFMLQEYEPLESQEQAMEENIEESQETVLVMTYVLDIIHSLVKKYNINWQESLEVICLYSVVYNVLKRPNLTVKFIVLALNVIAVTIRKFQPPNLSLLMETKPGSPLHELGNLIYMKLHDMHWEIRDSALEVLHEITQLSFIKFPPFQKQIVESNLINVAMALAQHDYEYYVQVSALKCITTACSVPAVWDHLKKQYPDVQERVLTILRTSPEGTVRKEACTALLAMYVNLKLTPAFKDTLYEQFVSTAISDSHWEAQLNALEFWRRVICSFLNEQGMLDGSFPQVTFSKETRKIVTLNQPEIQRRLCIVLEKLSEIGCLTVLVKSLYDDSELETVETGLKIASHLLNILDQYKVPEILKPRDNDPVNIEEVISNIVEDISEKTDSVDHNNVVPPTSDQVIEQILNSNDLNLLSGMYENQMNMDGDVDIQLSLPVPKIKLLKPASPYFFVNYVKSKDFKSVLEEKRKWNEGIRSLSSLLDDVLGIYELEDNEVNTLDCY